jgi:hypothetical protein
MKKRKLKVWGGSLDGRNRSLVGAYTKKQAVEILKQSPHGAGVTLHFFNGYWCETGNALELCVVNDVGVWNVLGDKNFKKVL